MAVQVNLRALGNTSREKELRSLGGSDFEPKANRLLTYTRVAQRAVVYVTWQTPK
jgi:hypothetical protein